MYLTPLTAAILSDAHEVIRRLLDHPLIDVNIPATMLMPVNIFRPTGCTVVYSPMAMARVGNNVAVVEQLEEHSIRTGGRIHLECGSVQFIPGEHFDANI